jgi:hypothetical protein
MQTPAEKRKNPRRTITYPAFIEMGEGAQPRECTLRDASQEGAQLDVADPKSVPNVFILAVSYDGAARRRCRVIWRTETQVGVEFLKDVKKPSRRQPVWTHTMRAAAAETRAPAAPQPAEAPAEPAADHLDIDTLTAR